MPLFKDLSRSNRGAAFALAMLVAAYGLLFEGQAAAQERQVPSAAQVRSQAPGYFRMTLGDFTVTALFDGIIDVDTSLLTNVTPTTLRTLLAARYETPPHIATSVNAYLIDTGNELVLIDTGTAKSLGPTLGFLVENLRAAGYRPEQVSKILITHLHPDHVGGLLTPDGAIAFPNATIYSAAADTAYWLHPARAANAPAAQKLLFTVAAAAADPYHRAGRWKTFEGASVLAHGITSVPLAGHTPGHTGFRVESAGSSLLVIGDTIHNDAAQLPSPGIGIQFDSDQKAAIAARTALFRQEAASGEWIAAAHLPFPGIGRLRANDRGYTWIPAPFQPVTGSAVK